MDPHVCIRLFGVKGWRFVVIETLNWVGSLIPQMSETKHGISAFQNALCRREIRNSPNAGIREQYEFTTFYFTCSNFAAAIRRVSTPEAVSRP